jgi:glycosyltransferase involved in cell wall biosynthesis
MSERKLTIIHLESSVGWGGQEIRVFNESRWFIERGHHVILIAPTSSRIYHEFQSLGWPAYPCSFQYRHTPWVLLYLIAKFRAIRPDAVNTHSNADSKLGLLAAKLAGVKNIIRSRHVSNPIGNSWHNRLLYKHLATHVVTTGDCISREVQKLGVPPAKISTVATGIEIPTENSSPTSLREELGLDPSNQLIGMVSVLRGWKGHSYLIQALDLLHHEFPHLHLVLAGDGPGRKSLQAKVDELKLERYVHFLGHRTDVFHIFQNLDIALLTSTKNEGIPQTLIQAMACKCPVIGTNVGGIPELLGNGKFGTLIPPEDPLAVKSAIQHIFKNPHKFETQVQAAYQHVASNFQIDSMGAQMFLIFLGMHLTQPATTCR